jgi:hypothetical protein
MMLFGLEFPERRQLFCQTCGASMTLTGREPHEECGRELHIFQCYVCKREVQLSPQLGPDQPRASSSA